MTERPFDRFDYVGLVDEFRCRPSEWVRTERDRVVRAQRAMRVRELALTRVLDERGQIDDAVAAADGVSVRSVREMVLTARALEDLPEIAAVAAAGGLSEAQLVQVAKLADPADDHRWAAEAPSWSPRDLADQVRALRTPTIEDAAARRAARAHRFWWNREAGMLDGRYSLADVDGALVETVFTRMIEQMRPATGQPWPSWEHRAADALVELCRAYQERDQHAPRSGHRAHFVVQVPVEGPATVAGVPLPDEMVERLRADARIEPVLVDGDGEPILIGRTSTVLSEKTKRSVKLRDGHCRWPGCEHRFGLQVHHLWPASWGGPDAIHNLATVCSFHHARLAPQGDRLLLGNPNTKNGLALVHRDELATLAADHARARPDAA